jgi:hypothetical protein
VVCSRPCETDQFLYGACRSSGEGSARRDTGTQVFSVWALREPETDTIFRLNHLCSYVIPRVANVTEEKMDCVSNETPM